MIANRPIEIRPANRGYIGIETAVPMRASFSSMDKPDWILRHEAEGWLLSMAVGLHAVVRILPMFSGQTNIIKAAVRNDAGDLVTGEQHVERVEDISHPYVRAAMIFNKLDKLQVDLQGSVSARMGLGGSSAMMTALQMACWHWKHNGRVPLQPRDLVRIVSYLELGPASNGFSLEGSHGVQDVVGCLAINLTGCAIVAMPIQPAVYTAAGVSWTWTEPQFDEAVYFKSEALSWVDQNLMMFSIMPRQSDASERLAVMTPAKGDVIETAELTKAAAYALSDCSFEQFSGTVRAAWELKLRMDPNIIPKQAQAFYNQAKAIGVRFIRITGAGHGGYFVIFCDDPDKRRRLIELSLQDPHVWYNPDATIAESPAGVMHFKPPRTMI